MNKLAEQYIVDVLMHEMGLSANNVWVMNQNRKIPNDLGLYIIVGMVDSEIISSSNTTTPSVDGMDELQQVVSRENIQIDILSRSNDALTRRTEIIAALNSVYSIQTQEAAYFRIFPLTHSFVNSSSAEGGSQINRFSLHVACHTWFRKEQALDNYFDSFLTKVDDANTITRITPTRVTASGDIRIIPSGDARIIAGKTALIEFNIP